MAFVVAVVLAAAFLFVIPKTICFFTASMEIEMSLGITAASPRRIWNEMIWTTDSSPNHVVIEVFGVAEGFRVMEIRDDGGFNSILDDAKEMMSRNAAAMGANAVISVRYNVVANAIFVYGTAVRVKTIHSNLSPESPHVY